MFIKRSLLASLAAWLALTVDAHADEAAIQERLWTFGGFGSIGAVHNSIDQADYVRSSLQSAGVGRSHSLDAAIDSMLGLQVNLAPGNDLNAMVQVVSRRGADNTFRPAVHWALMEYYLNDQTQIRLGRLGLDLYMLADSRSLGYSFVWARPPVEFFASIAITYFDGVDLICKRTIGAGVAQFKLYHGSVTEHPPGDIRYINAGTSVTGAHLDYQSEQWHYRFGYGQVVRNSAFMADAGASAAAPALPLTGTGDAGATEVTNLTISGKSVRFLSAGVVYENGPWQTQVAVAHARATNNLFATVNCAYVTAAVRSGRWTPFVTLAAVASLGSGQIAPSQTTQAFGVRYDLKRNLDVKFQLDRVHVRNASLWKNVTTPRWQGVATLVSASIDFVF